MSKRKREAKAKEDHQTAYFIKHGWTPLIRQGQTWWGKLK